MVHAMGADTEPAPGGQPIMERAGKRYELDVHFSLFKDEATVVVRTYDNKDISVQIVGDAIAEFEKRDRRCRL